MALSHERYLDMRLPAPFEAQAPVDNPEITLKQGVPVSLSERRSDNVGTPDYAALAERTNPGPGFTDYQKAGGTFSGGLYKAIMAGVIELQKPEVRENTKFTTGTKFQIKGFEDRHNKPFLGTELPKEEQIFLTQEQKDAYCLLRERFSIPEVDRQQRKAYYSDALMLEQVRIMPGLASSSSLEPYKHFMQEQEQSDAFFAAA